MPRGGNAFELIPPACSFAVARGDLSDILAEAKRQLHRETNYQIEAEFQRRYRSLVADDPQLVVPEIAEELTTRHILAMDFLDGIPLEDLAESSCCARGCAPASTCAPC